MLELANVGATLASAGKWCPPSPIDSVTDQNGKPVPVKRGRRASRPSSPGLANTLLTGLSKDDVSGTAAGAARQVGLEPADGGQDRHHPAAQVGRVRRRGPADGGCGDHIRRLQLPPPAVRRRRLTVRMRQRQHLRRQNPGPNLVRGDETAAGRPAGAAAAAHRPALPRRRPGRADPQRRRQAAQRGPRDPAARGPSRPRSRPPTTTPNAAPSSGRTRKARRCPARPCC